MSKLKMYYRKPKLYISLPSGLHFYDDEIENLSVYEEVGILPLTTMNEMELKNPEALLNGSAIESIIRDCTTLENIDPRKLLKCDIDAILLAIKKVSEDKDHEFEAKCPSCEHEFGYIRDLSNKLDTLQSHEKEYTVTLEDYDVVVYLRPLTFEQYLHIQDVQLKEKREMDSITRKLSEFREKSDEDITDEEQNKFFEMINNAFSKVTKTTMELFSQNIIKVYLRSDEVFEDDPEEIKEWVKQLDKANYDKISNRVAEINEIGLDDKETLTCPECEHKWEQPFDVNATHFFGSGS